MKSNTSKSVIRRYYLRCTIALFVYFVLIIPILLIYKNYISIAFVALLYLPVKIIIRIIANKTIASVLFDELDAKKYTEIIDYKRFHPPLTYRINSAISSGDYKCF